MQLNDKLIGFLGQQARSNCCVPGVACSLNNFKNVARRVFISNKSELNKNLLTMLF